MSENDKNLFDKNHYLFVGIAVIYLIYFLSFVDLERILTTTSDDASYYFKIAQNLTQGNGFNFDGINRTNGFHPLWFLVLLPFYYFFEGSQETAYRFCLLFQLIPALFSYILFFRIYSQNFSKKAWLPGTLIFLYLVFFRAINGMESALLIFCIMGSFYYGWEKRIGVIPNKKQEFIFGLILGLVCLTRLDMVFLVGAVFLFLGSKIILDRVEIKITIKTSLNILIGLVVTIIPYLLFNYLEFDHIIPISGTLKSSFPHLNSADKIWSNILGWKICLPSLSIFVVYLLWFFLIKKRETKESISKASFRTAMAVGAMGFILHYFYEIFFGKWGVFDWYFIPYALVTALILGVPIDYLAKHIFNKYGLILLNSLLLLVLINYVYKKSTRPLDWHITSYRAAVWARTHTKTNDIFAMKDAGNFGFFSQRSVINLDGLVNSFEFQEILKSKKLKKYFQEKGVNYLVQHAFDIENYSSIPMHYYSHLYEVPSDPIWIKKSKEVYRSKPYSRGTEKTYLVIWTLNNE